MQLSLFIDLGLVACRLAATLAIWRQHAATAGHTGVFLYAARMRKEPTCYCVTQA